MKYVHKHRELLTILYFVSIISVLCVIIMVQLVHNPVSMASKTTYDYERMQGPVSGQVFWDTVRFESLDYQTMYDDMHTDYHVGKQDGQYLYDRTCYVEDKPVFSYACILNAEDYHNLITVLIGMCEEETELTNGASWNAVWNMGGKGYNAGGIGESGYLTGDYTLVEWINGMEMTHENLYDMR